MNDLNDRDFSIDELAEIRRVFRQLEELAPPSRDLADLTSRTTADRDRWQPAAFAVTVAAVAVLVGLATGMVLRSATELGTSSLESTASPPANSTPDASGGSGSTPPTDSTTPPGVDTGLRISGYDDVHRHRSSGKLWGLRDGHVWSSNDEGGSWSIRREGNHDFELLEVLEDGSVLAFRNPNDVLDGVLAPGSISNPTPEVHRYDAAGDQWDVMTLPRPELPVYGPDPEPENGQCALFGLQSWVDASAGTVGDEVLVLGRHRVVADGICDEEYPFLWSSPDGIGWSLQPVDLSTGYPVGLESISGTYVAYGANSPSFVLAPTRHLMMWTSIDLKNWNPVGLDLTNIPAGRVPALDQPTDVERAGDQLRISIPMVQVPEIDTTIADFDELRARLTEFWPGGSNAFLDQQSLDDLGVDFPLDEAEIQELRAFYYAERPSGQLILELDPDTGWTTAYEPSRP